MTISEIQSLTYEKAKEMALETMQIKGHECILTELGDYFGYSVLVFKNGKHIYYANDYQLHHSYKVKQEGKESLRDFFIEKMNNILYTDAEMLATVESYDEYEKKEYFLRNYWIMRHDYVSAFCIGDDQKKELEKAKKKFPLFNPISFCYVADENIIKEQAKYKNHLDKAFKDLKENAETFREMIRSELANHEACVTCSAEDALHALGLIYDELADWKKTIVTEELNKAINNYAYA